LELSDEGFAALVDAAAERAFVELSERLLPAWLNERDAAAYLGLTPKAIGNARRAGKLRGCRHGRTYIYERSELDRFGRDGS
jgi:hypothetical protein